MIPPAVAEKAYKKNIPLDVQFELTWKCNQRCVHCYQFPYQEKELTTGQIQNILSQLAEASALFLSFTGGEPLTRPDFWEIAEFARLKNFVLSLQTNATLIDEQAARRIQELNFLAVHVSILGATAATHDAITRLPGSFDKTLSALELLKCLRIRSVLNYTLMPANFSDFKGILNLKERLGKNCDIRISPYIYPSNDGKRRNEEFKLDEGRLKEFFRWLKETTSEQPFRGLTPGCTPGRISCTINSRGQLYPCVALPRAMGDLTKNSFASVWRNNPQLDELRNMDMARLKECSECSLADSCFRCPGLAFLETGNAFAGGSESCRMSRIRKEVGL